MKTKLLLVIVLFVGLQTVAQSVFNYSVREYYIYNPGKKTFVKDVVDKVRTTLIVDDEKRLIKFKISGVEEVAIFDKLVIKGFVKPEEGLPFLHYIYKDANNDEIHFYISKESARIKPYGSMLKLIE